MTEQQAPDTSGQPASDATDAAATSEENTAPEQVVVVIGPDGTPIGTIPASALPGSPGESSDAEPAEGEDRSPRRLSDLVEQPAKVMRIGSMIRQLLEEVKAAPLDEASRNRLKEIHEASVKELEAGLAPELVEELNRLSLPFTDGETPSDGELRIAQAQLVGWLEGLFHGIQAAIHAQQVATQAQMEQIRRGLPMGVPTPAGQPQQQVPGAPQGGPGQPAEGEAKPGSGGGMYL